MYTTFKRLKKWKTWEETCQGFFHRWTTRKSNIDATLLPSWGFCDLPAKDIQISELNRLFEPSIDPK
jgi:hypothetical protein